MATLLNDGRVFLAGGHNNTHIISGAEVFDPKRGTWSDAGNLSVPRDPTATLLANGQVLLSGGIDWYIGGGKAYAETETFDPVTGRWTVTGSLNAPRFEHRAVRLDDGRVLVMGGYGGGKNCSQPLKSTIPRPAVGKRRMICRSQEPGSDTSNCKTDTC